MSRRQVVLLGTILALLVVAIGRPVVVHGSALSKKACSKVARKVNGHKKKVRVCHTLRPATATSTPTLTSTATLTATPMPTPFPISSATPIPTGPPSYTLADPIIIQVIPLNIPGYSTVDPAAMQQDLDNSRAFYQTYGIGVQYDVSQLQTVAYGQFETTHIPCTTDFDVDEYRYMKSHNLLTSHYVTIYSPFSEKQCYGNSGTAAGFTSFAPDDSNKRISWAVISYPYDQHVEEHEDGRKLGPWTNDLASCYSRDCVAAAVSDIADDVMGAGNGGFNIVDEQTLGLHPNIMAFTNGTRTVSLEPRALMNAELKGIKVPYTLKDGKSAFAYIQERAPLGGDVRVKEPQVIIDVFDDNAFWWSVADDTIELPPLKQGDVVTNAVDGWTLKVDSLSASNAVVTVSFSK